MLLTALLTVTAVFGANVNPFVTSAGTGHDVDFLNLVLSRAAIPAPASVQVTNTIPECLEAVRNSNATYAFCVGSVSITSGRQLTMDFVPNFENDIHVMARSNRDFNSMVSRIIQRFFVAVAIIVAFMIVIVSVFAPLAYAAEIMWCEPGRTPLFWSEKDDEGGTSVMYRMGIGMLRALGWTLVTMFGTKTSYPESSQARVIHATLKIVSKLLIITTTAVLAAVFSVSASSASIESYDDLGGDTVCTVAGTTSDIYMNEHPRGFTKIATANVDEMFTLFFDHKCDAVVYDRPVLEAELARRALLKLPGARIVGDSLRSELFGIAMPLNAPYRRDVSNAALEAREDDVFMTTLQSRYFEGGDASYSDDSLDVPIAWYIVPSLLWIGVFIGVILFLYLRMDNRQEEYKTTSANATDDDRTDDLEIAKKNEKDMSGMYYGPDYLSQKSDESNRRQLRLALENSIAIRHMSEVLDRLYNFFDRKDATALEAMIRGDMEVEMDSIHSHSELEEVVTEV
ncbi:MAG: hypothetical protein CMK92_01050 [Pseudomonas sp.]|nr:hypothetical protein [Pseudomonas sp.]